MGRQYTLVRALIRSITHATFDLLRSFIGIFSRVLYSDTEGSFMVERVLQIAEACIEDMPEYSHHFHNNVQDCEVKMHPNSILENIFYFRVCSYTEQIALVNYLDKFIEEHKDVSIFYPLIDNFYKCILMTILDFYFSISQSHSICWILDMDL